MNKALYKALQSLQLYKVSTSEVIFQVFFSKRLIYSLVAAFFSKSTLCVPFSPLLIMDVLIGKLPFSITFCSLTAQTFK